MLAAFLIAVASIVPQDDVLRDHVERFEVNALYDDCGRHVFTQLIGWTTEDRVRFWRLAKTSSLRPERDYPRGGYRLLWNDGGVTRNVWARSCGEAFMQFDPELADRLILPQKQRRELRGLRVKR